MSAQVQSIITTGVGGIIVDIECHLSNNLPNIIIVGFANKAVDEAKERIRGAFSDSHIVLPRKRITINLAPADVPKADSGLDLAIAASELLNKAARHLNISARAYMRSVKVARTIADLEASTPITAAHISEALAYRSQNYKEN
jgi:predicted ATPase with chaperone activity